MYAYQSHYAIYIYYSIIIIAEHISMRPIIVQCRGIYNTIIGLVLLCSAIIVVLIAFLNADILYTHVYVQYVCIPECRHNVHTCICTICLHS